MFSPKIVSSDAFLDMPTSTRELYFQLGMYADDDGFINPRKIIRMIGASEDDLKVLIGKRFVLPFESGVVVIKHWAINNLIRKDWYQETIYTDEKKSLTTKENGSYTESVNELVNNSATEVRLGKVRLDKNTSEETSQNIPLVIDGFKEINPSYKKWFGNKTQRAAAQRLIESHGMEQLMKVIGILSKTNVRPYLATITTPLQLEDKWAQLESGLKKMQSEKISDPKIRVY